MAMNESTLNALINLFAVFSFKGEQDYDIAYRNLEEYLTNQLGIKNPEEYLALFYELFDLYNSGIHDLNDEKTKVIVGKICHQIKSRIHHSDQVLIFLRFLELAKSDFNTVDHGLYDLVAEIFGIKENDYAAFKHFIFSETPENIDASGFLHINKNRSHPGENVFHVQKENLQGDLLVYYIAEIEQFVFRYFGNDPLYLEGSSLRQNQFYIFNQGSIIRGKLNTSIYYTEISAIFFKFQSSDPLVFTSNAIEYTFSKSNNGIHNFSFSEPSGQLIAVMGGSGVGKSTLLNVLNGSLPLKSGKVTINGIDIHEDYKKIEGLIGYIPQDDLVFEELTVYQNIYFNALLCLNHLSVSQIRERIDKLLKDLSLFEIRNHIVGNPLAKVLSGGQRKRLNIALELIREPAILFVDEPTSGLSSSDSEKIMVLLKQQAHRGKLIIVNIHQPSSFIYRLFDKLWIFDKGGYPIYAGNPLDAIVYFKEMDKHIDPENCECSACGNVNPEQVLEIIGNHKFDESGRLTGERKFSPEELHSTYQEKIQKKVDFIAPETTNDPVANLFKPSRLKQFKIFLTRNLKTKISNLQYIYINLLQAPVLALVVSFLTRYSTEDGYFFGLNKNFPSYLFMAIIVMLFQGMSLSAEEIIRDRKIMQREAFLRLSRLSYLNSKIVFLLAVSLLQSFLFVAISSWVLGMEGLFIKYWTILFLTAAFANMAGLNISSGLNSVVTIYITIPLLIIPQILLCGLIVKFDDLKGVNSKKNAVPVIGDVMVSRWAFEALAVEQYTKNKYDINYYDIEREMSGYFIKGELIIPRLSNLIGSVSFNRTVKNNQLPELNSFKTIVNEMKQMDRDSLIPVFGHYDCLNSERFTRSMGDSAAHHLDQLRTIYKNLYLDAERKKDNITAKLVTEMGQEELINYKKLYHNTSLATILTNQNIDNSLVQAGDKFLIKVAPIFRAPESRSGRAHFYAPCKVIGNLEISTFYFNSGVIFLMIMVLYLALYFDWLKKSINYFGNLKLKFR